MFQAISPPIISLVTQHVGSWMNNALSSRSNSDNVPLLARMTATLNDLAAAVVKLPTKERAFLAEELLASLDDAKLEKNWAEEAKRRRDDVRSGRVKPIESEDVYRRIEDLLKK